ncbi:MAG: thioredoxin domain-containing protein, partial [Pseudomonadota bacterium]|nr:thioredoxin domain-containing protein [Pseudomonadota bacterium]
WPSVEKYPHGHVSLVTALEEHVEQPEIIIIRGSEPELQQWQTNAAQIYAPRRMVFAIPADARNLPGALTDRVPVENNTIAYRCVGSYCSLPMTSWEALSAELVKKTKMKKDD